MISPPFLLISFYKDVGATNMWKFLVYLLMTAMLCNYAALVSGNTIRAIVEDNGFFSRQFPDRNGNMRFLPYSVSPYCITIFI